MWIDFKMLFVYRRPFKNNWFFVVNTRNKLIWSFSRHCFVLEFIKETCVTAWRHEICRKLGSSRSKVKHMIKETQMKIQDYIFPILKFFCYFFVCLFVCCCCFSLLFFRFLLISGLSALCHWYTLVMKEGIYLLVTNYMSPFHGCVMFTCATILLTYRSTMKHSPIATKIIKFLWGCPICSLIHRCWGCILKV